LVIFLFIEK